MLDTSPRGINPCILFSSQFPCAFFAKDSGELAFPAEKIALATMLIATHTDFPSVIILLVSLHLIRAFGFDL
jgi:hypothetical protein